MRARYRLVRIDTPFQLPDPRFDRLARLVGDTAMARLAAAHVMVVGVGGVGSWAAEALIRSGVGRLTLVDFDDVCITNFNRQLHALDGFVGQPKAEVMAARLRLVNPRAEIRVLPAFYSDGSSAQILAAGADFTIDAIDSLSAKCHLLAACHRQNCPIVCATGSAGRLDPARIEVADLAATDVDPLARMVRKLLRQRHGFPRQGPFGIPAVFSREEPILPHAQPCDQGRENDNAGTPDTDETAGRHRRAAILGSAAFVTGAFGLQCAAVVVRILLGGKGN